jgi:hypothetical protein
LSNGSSFLTAAIASLGRERRLSASGGLEREAFISRATTASIEIYELKARKKPCDFSQLAISSSERAEDAIGLRGVKIRSSDLQGGADFDGRRQQMPVMHFAAAAWPRAS